MIDRGAVSYYEQRRVFAGSINEPDTKRYTRTGNTNNFGLSSPLQDDDAITATLNSLQVNEIRHFVPLTDLLVFTSGSEWKVNSGPDAAFSASSLKQRPQSTWGCSFRPPLVLGDTVIFLQDDNINVRSLFFDLTLEGYTGRKLNLLAQHLVEGKSVIDWCASTSPESRVYMVRSDGALLTMSFEKDEDVIAWTPWDTRGKYEAVGSLRHDEDSSEDTIFMVVKRKINGSIVRYIEYWQQKCFDEVRDVYYVDCGLTLDNPITITDVSATNPVVITAASHGLVAGDVVDFSDIEFDNEIDEFGVEIDPDQLNNRRFVVTSALTANTFDIEDDDGNPIDGSSWRAYLEGGKVRKAVNSITGLHHLEGQTVDVLADGNFIPGITVTDARISLVEKASRVHVGLNYISDIETLDVEAPEGAGTAQGKIMSVSDLTIRFEKSRGLLAGPNENELVEVSQREYERYGDPTALITGDHEMILQPHWNSNGRVLLRQKYPLPMKVLAIIPNVHAED
jgi:hypothetical protein